MRAGLHGGRRLQVGWKRVDLLLTNLPHRNIEELLYMRGHQVCVTIWGSLLDKVEQMNLDAEEV